MKSVINEILEKHTKVGNYERESYMIKEDIEILIKQNENKVVMWGFNHKTDRFLNLSTKPYKRLIDGFKAVSSDLYGKGNYTYITLDTSNEKDKISSLNGRIDILNHRNEILQDENKIIQKEIEKYKQEIKMLKDKIDILEHENKVSTELINIYKKEIEGLKENTTNKETLIHNARGAGRKVKFNEEQINQIKSLRLEGYTIKDIAKKYKCSVGLIHKLISEK